LVLSKRFAPRIHPISPSPEYQDNKCDNSKRHTRVYRRGQHLLVFLGMLDFLLLIGYDFCKGAQGHGLFEKSGIEFLQLLHGDLRNIT